MVLFGVLIHMYDTQRLHFNIDVFSSKCLLCDNVDFYLWLNRLTIMLTMLDIDEHL
jgi:hypothetical protein